jgi:signal recognition particle GTPase
VYEDFEGTWNIRHSDYNNKFKRDTAMLKLMGELLKRDVGVESVEVLLKKIKSIKNVHRKELTKIKK